ncbi:hypothetical protein GIB67_014037, partial [Kingdonia uniflora]
KRYLKLLLELELDSRFERPNTSLELWPKGSSRSNYSQPRSNNFDPPGSHLVET